MREEILLYALFAVREVKRDFYYSRVKARNMEKNILLSYSMRIKQTPNQPKHDFFFFWLATVKL